MGWQVRELSFMWQASNLESNESCCTASRRSVERQVVGGTQKVRELVNVF